MNPPPHTLPSGRRIAGDGILVGANTWGARHTTSIISQILKRPAQLRDLAWAEANPRLLSIAAKANGGLLDTYSRLVSKRNNQVEARFVAKFYDSNLQYIGQTEGSRAEQMPSVWVHGKAAPQIAAQINQQTELQVSALKQFDASLKTLVTSGNVDHVASN